MGTGTEVDDGKETSIKQQTNSIQENARDCKSRRTGMQKQSQATLLRTLQRAVAPVRSGRYVNPTRS